MSTARNYARLLQMLLNDGTLYGVRLLAPRTVALMTTNQVGTLYSDEWRGFGLGFFTVERSGADDTLLPVGATAGAAPTAACTGWTRRSGWCWC